MNAGYFDFDGHDGFQVLNSYILIKAEVDRKFYLSDLLILNEPSKNASWLQIEFNDKECQLTEFIGIPFISPSISRDSVCIFIKKTSQQFKIRIYEFVFLL